MPIESFRLPLTPEVISTLSLRYSEELNALGTWAPQKIDQFELVIEENKWKLAWRGENFNPLELQWEKSWNYHTQFFKGKSPFGELLIKALGLSPHKKSTVLDATLGMGEDTLLMLMAGASVVATERMPLLLAMHVNQLKLIQGPLKEVVNTRFKLVPQNSRQYEGPVDVAYFDPMYSHPNQKAGPKKEMLFLRELVGADEDAQEIVQSWKGKVSRLVVKRPISAPHLIENPSMSFKGKSTRYDVYLS